MIHSDCLSVCGGGEWQFLGRGHECIPDDARIWRTAINSLLSRNHEQIMHQNIQALRDFGLKTLDIVISDHSFLLNQTQQYNTNSAIKVLVRQLPWVCFHLEFRTDTDHPLHTRLPVPGLPSEDLVMLIPLSLTYPSANLFLPLLLRPTEGRDINECTHGAQNRHGESWSTLGRIWGPTSPWVILFLVNLKTRFFIVKGHLLSHQDSESTVMSELC